MANRADRDAAVERGWQAFAIRKGGHSYKAIAAQLGVNERTVRRDIRRVLDDLNARALGQAELYQRMQLERINDMWKGVWPAILRGDLEAVRTGLRIMEREAKLLGLDAPTKIDIEQRIRIMAEREGFDPDEAVIEAKRWLKEARESWGAE